MSSIAVLVITNQPKNWHPLDKAYYPIFVGAAGRKDLVADVQKDNIGDNISNKNPNYCELTGLYWAWKNLHCDYIGLCHYRRYFVKNVENNEAKIFSGQDFIDVFNKGFDIILPKKLTWSVDTVRIGFNKAHISTNMDIIERLIRFLYPDYINDFLNVMNSHGASYYNMFVMNKDRADKYCEWLFKILFELEKRIDISHYNDYQKRVFGYIAERLLNVWVEHQNLKKYYCDVVQINLK